jgi:hypothetical protein
MKTRLPFRPTTWVSIACLCLFGAVSVANAKRSAGNAYTWPAYTPTLNYRFEEEFPAMTMPTRDLEDCPGVVGRISSGWWTFCWGKNKRSVVDSTSISLLLQRMNDDFAYFRDSLGWPPDRRAKEGYRSSIYLYGSGLCTDRVDSNALGGWQSAIRFKGSYYPMVLISYYPVAAYHPSCTYSDKEYQKSAVVHEGIHSVLADLPGCKQAAWFQEGGNTWLQQEANARRYGDYSSMGFLNAASFIAPFMPIECYSGWLQDGSFGGPSAEGVDRTEQGKQVCTWRNLLGGVQYSNIFPTFLGLTLGKGSIAWIWRHCPGRVLEGMAAGLGEAPLRRLITEYRAKQALLDMGPWTAAVQRLMDNSMGTVIQSEWKPCLKEVAPWKATPYAATTLENGWLIPDPNTLPGWSGANQIPLHATGKDLKIAFKPLSEHLVCQLCYRTADGQTVYSQPVEKGICQLTLTQRPANDVVFVVITNTDFTYKGEISRTTKFDYRIQLLQQTTTRADIHRPWYHWSKSYAY